MDVSKIINNAEKSGIKKLKLASTGLKKFPDNLKELTSLEELYLFDNSLREIQMRLVI